MSRPRVHDLEDEVLALLAAHPGGLGAPTLQRLLSSRPSQPTLARRLLDLRARGKVLVEGRGPATRYHLVSGNELPKLRSRLLHEAVALKLVRNPSLIDHAQQRLERLRSTNPSAHRYHARWRALLAGPQTALLRAMTEDSDSAADLRQESPFSTLLTPRERERVFKRLHA
jgi:hypothetical protein